MLLIIEVNGLILFIFTSALISSSVCISLVLSSSMDLVQYQFSFLFLETDLPRWSYLYTQYSTHLATRNYAPNHFDRTPPLRKNTGK